MGGGLAWGLSIISAGLSLNPGAAAGNGESHIASSSTDSPAPLNQHCIPATCLPGGRGAEELFSETVLLLKPLHTSGEIPASLEQIPINFHMAGAHAGSWH